MYFLISNISGLVYFDIRSELKSSLFRKMGFQLNFLITTFNNKFIYNFEFYFTKVFEKESF